MDQDNVSNVFLSLRATLMRVVSRIVPPKEIEDIVQETYVRVCQLGKCEEIQYPRSLMLKTAKNLALDHLKRAETRLASSMDDESEYEADPQWSNADETYNKVVADREFALFCEAVRLLPPQCRKPFVLKKVYGFSQKEIAARLQIAESTVEKHIAKGLRRCAQVMSERAEFKISKTLAKKRSEGISP